MPDFEFKFFNYQNTPQNYFDFRRQVYLADLAVSIENTPDEYDKVSELMGVFYDNILIGGAWLTEFGEKGLPLESYGVMLSDYFDIKDFHDLGAGEISRLFVLPQHRNRNMLEQLYLQMNRRRGQKNLLRILTIAPNAQARLTSIICQKLGYMVNMIKDVPLAPGTVMSSIKTVCVLELQDNNQVR